MIEREFIKNKLHEFTIKGRIHELIGSRAGIGGITFEKTPLGEKVIIDAVKPGLVIGRGGETIKNLTSELKSKFNLENPQVEVREILNPNLNAQVIARNIVFELENFGPKRFKPLSYRSLTKIMRAGALGCELKLSGRIPSQRAKNWRFFNGYMKKCGDVAQNYVDSVVMVANTRAGAIGVKVKIMLPGTPLPDRVEFKTIVVQEEDAKGKIISSEEIPVEKIEKEILTEKPLLEVKLLGKDSAKTETAAEKKTEKVVEKEVEKKKIIEKPKTSEEKPAKTTSKAEIKSPSEENEATKKLTKKPVKKESKGDKK